MTGQSTSHAGGSLVAVALGANVGDRMATLAQAVDALRDRVFASVDGVSDWLETAPVGMEEQPDFLNGAMVGRSELSPRELLSVLHAIERDHGRDRASETRWGPRTLDLDLLLYGDLQVDEPGLHLPHPRMRERRFVLDPLVSIAPDLRHPECGRTMAELQAVLSAASV